MRDLACGGWITRVKTRCFQWFLWQGMCQCLLKYLISMTKSSQLALIGACNEVFTLTYIWQIMKTLLELKGSAYLQVFVHRRTSWNWMNTTYEEGCFLMIAMGTSSVRRDFLNWRIMSTTGFSFSKACAENILVQDFRHVRSRKTTANMSILCERPLVPLYDVTAPLLSLFDSHAHSSDWCIFDGVGMIQLLSSWRQTGKKFRLSWDGAADWWYYPWPLKYSVGLVK